MKRSEMITLITSVMKEHGYYRAVTLEDFSDSDGDCLSGDILTALEKAGMLPPPKSNILPYSVNNPGDVLKNFRWEAENA